MKLIDVGKLKDEMVLLIVDYMRTNEKDFGKFAVHALNTIDEQKIVDPVKRSHWERIYDQFGAPDGYKCAECKTERRFADYERKLICTPYCSFCGAKMKGVNE